MQEKIELNRVRNFNEIIEDSIQFFKQNWRPLLKAYFSICGLFILASLVVGLFNPTASLIQTLKGESSPSSYFLSLLFNVLEYLSATLTTLSYISLYKEKGNESPSVAEVWSYFKFYFIRTLGSWLALFALIVAGTLCCFIPGIYLAIVLSLTLPIMIMENTTLGYAFNRSFQLIKNNWWFTFLVFLVIEIILVVVMFAFAIPAMLIASASLLFTTTTTLLQIYLYVIIVIGHIFQFLYILPVIGITLTYFSFTEMKDGGTLLQRIMMIGKSSTYVHAYEPPTEEY